MPKISFILLLWALTATAMAQTLSINVTPSNALAFRWTATPGAQGYRVEYRDSLTAGSWLPYPWQDQWPQLSTNWNESLASTPNRYYRVLALLNVRGSVVSSSLAGMFTTNQLRALFLSAGITTVPQNAVAAYSVIYETITADGAPVRASGAFFRPVVTGRSLPLLSLQHGTVVETNNVASKGTSGDAVLGLVWASVGYVSALPDYLGLGSGPGMHPYLHARSEATAAIDFLRASRSICTQLSVQLNGQVFLAGYSQGGHATMALHRELQTHYTNEFAVTASAPMAGPYAVWETVKWGLLMDTPPDSDTYFLPYILFGHNSVYRLYNSPSEVMAEPYASTLPPLFDGAHTENEINDAMPPIPNAMFKPAFLQDVLNNSQNHWTLALKRNDVYNWRPTAPMRLYHSQNDEIVPYTNAVIALNAFHANGATHVILTNPGPAGASHGAAALPIYTAARQWFDSLKQ